MEQVSKSKSLPKIVVPYLSGIETLEIQQT